MSDRLKILHCDYDSVLNPFAGGGQAKATLEMYSRLQDKYDVTVLIGNYPGAARTTVNGLSYIPVGIGSLGPTISILSYWLLMPFIARKMKKDLIVEFFTAPIGPSILPIINKSALIAFASFDFSKELSERYRLPFDKLFNTLIRNYKHVITLTELAANRLKQYYPNINFYTLGRGISDEFINYSGIEGDYITYIGRIDIYQKCLDIVIETWKKFKDQNNKVPKLYIAGSGKPKDVETLKELIKEFSLEEDVIYLGKVLGNEKLKLMGNSLAIINISRYETFCNSALEALALGKPLICTDIEGFSWIPAGGALKIDNIDSNNLINNLNNIINDKGLRGTLTNKAREISTEYSWTNISKQFSDMADKILEKQAIRILFFGTYERDYPRNQIVKKGLNGMGIETLECWANKPKLSFKNSLSFLSFLIRLPFSCVFRYTYLPIKAISIYLTKKFNYIWVAFPGHIDIPTAVLVSQILKKPILFDPLVSLHDTLVDDRKIIKNKFISSLLYHYEKIIYKYIDFILIDTESHKKYFTDKFNISPDKIKVIYVGSDNDIYKPNEKVNDGDISEVHFFGWHSPLHGVEYILKAAKIVQLKTENIKFLLIGEGQNYLKNLKLAEHLGLSNVTFLRSMPQKDAAAYLKNADIILGIFSKNDKSNRVIPNKVYQGIAMKKVVITGDSEAIREKFKNNKNIILINPEDHSNLAELILHIHDNKALQAKIAEDGYKLFNEEFTPAKIGEQLYSLLAT